jgi:hypothetical protein
VAEPAVNEFDDAAKLQKPKLLLTLCCGIINTDFNFNNFKT